MNRDTLCVEVRAFDENDQNLAQGLGEAILKGMSRATPPPPAKRRPTKKARIVELEAAVSELDEELMESEQLLLDVSNEKARLTAAAVEDKKLIDDLLLTKAALERTLESRGVRHAEKLDTFRAALDESRQILDERTTEVADRDRAIGELQAWVDVQDQKIVDLVRQCDAYREANAELTVRVLDKDQTIEDLRVLEAENESLSRRVENLTHRAEVASKAAADRQGQLEARDREIADLKRQLRQDRPDRGSQYCTFVEPSRRAPADFPGQSLHERMVSALKMALVASSLTIEKEGKDPVTHPWVLNLKGILKDAGESL